MHLGSMQTSVGTSVVPESLDVVRPLIVESHWCAEVRLGALRLDVGHQERELIRVKAMARAETVNKLNAHLRVILGFSFLLFKKATRVLSSQETYLAVTTTNRKVVSMFFSPESEDPLFVRLPGSLPPTQGQKRSSR